MSAPIDQRVFATSPEPFAITIALWRGAMIERFARAEDAIFLCLRAMRGCDNPLPPEAFHDGAKARLRALIATLETGDFGSAGKAALRSLNLLLEIHDNRTSLAHGKIARQGQGIEIEWVHPTKGVGLKFQRRSLRLVNLVEELSALDALQRALGSQLGQIRKIVADRAGV